MRAIYANNPARFFYLLVFVLCCLSGCTKESAKSLHVATNVWVGYEPLYLARSLNYFPDSAVVLHEMSNASDVIKAFRNNTIDAAALTLDEALLLIQDGIDAKILLVTDISNGADVVMARPGIKEIKDLKGKRVGAESGALGAYLLSRALEKGGLRPQDITVVPTTLEAHEEAYLSGKVDAIVTFEPIRTKLLGKGAHIIFDSSMIAKEVFDVIVVRPDVYQKNPRALQELEMAWYKALAYLRSNPDDACQRMAKREGVSALQFKDSLKGIIIPDEKENQQLLSGDIVVSASRLADVMLREKLLKNAVDPARLLNQNQKAKVP